MNKTEAIERYWYLVDKCRRARSDREYVAWKAKEVAAKEVAAKEAAAKEAAAREAAAEEAAAEEAAAKEVAAKEAAAKEAAVKDAVPPTDRNPELDVPLGNNPAPFSGESVTTPGTPDALKNNE